MRNKLYILLIALLTLTTSCKHTEYVIQKETVRDTLIQHQTRHDSIYLHDSIYIREKGDTVIIEKTRYKYVNKNLHDTLYISHTDTVPQIVEVERKLTIKEKFYMKSGEYLLPLFLIILTGIIVYIITKLRKKIP